MADLTGKELGNYRVVERIDRGGMAEVYKGVHTNLDRQVAIKVLHGHLLEGGDFIARFKREAKAVANLRHPNIVQVFDFDIQDETIFMVMEYIDGTNLRKRMSSLEQQGERLSIVQIGSIINDVAQALDYAHSKGMLHRDVKPSNILLDNEDKAYLTDFGIARILGDQKFTATGMLVGTPAYMSPEQGSGDELTKESDIYSLGVVAFEMLTGQVPYDAQTPIGIVHKQISEPIPDISELVDDVPDTTQVVIDTALAKEPDRRYSSGDALVIALRGALHALETSDPTLKVPLSAEPTREDALDAPTVEMEEAKAELPETLLMEEDEAVDEVDIPSTPEPTHEAPPTEVEAEPARKIPRWAFIVGGVVLVGVVGLILSQVLGVGPTESPPEPTPKFEQTQEPAPEVIIPAGENLVFAFPHTAGGLASMVGGDADVEVVSEGGEELWRTGNSRVLPSDDGNQIRDQYMIFDVDDGLIFEGNPTTDVLIEVEYLNVGNDQFRIEYDAVSGGPYGDGTFKETEWFRKTDSGEFITAAFKLEDANFANRIQGGDFRFNDDADGYETIRSVTVTLLGMPDLPEVPAGLTGEQYFDEGTALMGQDQWLEALAFFNAAVESGFEPSDLYHLRALAKINTGDLDGSIEDWTKAIGLNADIHEYWRERGIRKSERGQPFDALEDLNRGLEINPEDPVGYRARSAVYAELGQVPEAIQDAILAIRYEPDSIYGLETLMAVYPARSDSQSADEVMEVLDLALEFDPANSLAHSLRGEVFWFDWGDQGNAQEAFDIAVENASPDDTRSYEMRASFYMQTGRCDLAVEDYTHAIELGASNPWIYQGRGECFVQLGQEDFTREDYTTFMLMSADMPELEDLRQEIQSWLDSHPE